MTMRQRKRRMMRRAVPALSMLGRRFPAIRWRKRGPIRDAVPLSAITFPSPSDTWGTVTHALGPFVPLPIRRDVRFERRLARMREWARAALVITEEWEAVRREIARAEANRGAR